MEKKVKVWMRNGYVESNYIHLNDLKFTRNVGTQSSESSWIVELLFCSLIQKYRTFRNIFSCGHFRTLFGIAWLQADWIFSLNIVRYLFASWKAISCICVLCVLFRDFYKTNESNEFAVSFSRSPLHLLEHSIWVNSF